MKALVCEAYGPIDNLVVKDTFDVRRNRNGSQ